MPNARLHDDSQRCNACQPPRQRAIQKSWIGISASIGRRYRTSAFLGARRSPSAKFHLSWPVSGLVNFGVQPSHVDYTVAYQTLVPMYWHIHLPLRGQHTFGQCFPFNSNAKHWGTTTNQYYPICSQGSTYYLKAYNERLRQIEIHDHIR